MIPICYGILYLMVGTNKWHCDCPQQITWQYYCMDVRESLAVVQTNILALCTYVVKTWTLTWNCMFYAGFSCFSHKYHHFVWTNIIPLVNTMYQNSRLFDMVCINRNQLVTESTGIYSSLWNKTGFPKQAAWMSNYSIQTNRLKGNNECQHKVYESMSTNMIWVNVNSWMST